MAPFWRTMKIPFFIESYDDALTSEQCEKIIDFINSSDLTPGLVQTPLKNDLIKSEKDSWDISLDADDEGSIEINDLIFNSLTQCIQEYKKQHPQINQLASWRYFPDYNLQKYNPGQAYHSNHCENMNPVSSHRVLAWMYYLNTITDGGGTYFDNYDLTMNAVQGRCVIWPAYWTHMHKGIVSKTETKYIATGWMNYIDSA